MDTLAKALAADPGAFVVVGMMFCLALFAVGCFAYALWDIATGGDYERARKRRQRQRHRANLRRAYR